MSITRCKTRVRQKVNNIGGEISLREKAESLRLDAKPDYQAIRFYVLEEWSLSKRTETKIRIAQALDMFIAELEEESLTPTSIQQFKETGTKVSLPNEPIPEPEVVKKSAKILLWLGVENGSKFIRRKKKVRESIENYCLAHYKAKKTSPDGREYTFTILYENDEHLDKQVYDLLEDMHHQASMDDCFIEVSISEVGTDKRW